MVKKLLSGSSFNETWNDDRIYAVILDERENKWIND